MIWSCWCSRVVTVSSQEAQAQLKSTTYPERHREHRPQHVTLQEGITSIRASRPHPQDQRDRRFESNRSLSAHHAQHRQGLHVVLRSRQGLRMFGIMWGGHPAAGWWSRCRGRIGTVIAAVLLLRHCRARATVVASTTPCGDRGGAKTGLRRAGRGPNIMTGDARCHDTYAGIAMTTVPAGTDTPVLADVD